MGYFYHIQSKAKKDLVSLKGKTVIDLIQKHKNKEKILELLMNHTQLYYYGKTKNSHRRLVGSTKS